MNYEFKFKNENKVKKKIEVVEEVKEVVEEKVEEIKEEVKVIEEVKEVKVYKSKKPWFVYSAPRPKKYYNLNDMLENLENEYKDKGIIKTEFVSKGEQNKLNIKESKNRKKKTERFDD